MCIRDSLGAMRARKALGEPLLEGARRLLWQVLGDDHLVRQLARLIIVLGEELRCV